MRSRYCDKLKRDQVVKTGKLSGSDNFVDLGKMVARCCIQKIANYITIVPHP